MKKIIFVSAVFTLIVSLTFVNCKTPAEKVEIAKENVEKANRALDSAKKEYQEYLADVEAYRKVTAEVLAANKQKIVELNAKVENTKKASNEILKKQIAELSQRNMEMEKRLNEYKNEGKEKWEKFKVEFSHDIEELNKAINNLKVDNVK